MALAAESDAAIVIVGDLAGLFRRGTSGEGCDASDLDLPGVQSELATAVLDTGTPVVLVVVSGRPYALSDLAPRCAAVVQAFFPGEKGGAPGPGHRRHPRPRPAPLHPFGRGRSHTTVEYRDLTLGAPAIPWSGRCAS
ncbi:glycoside hydrolase family 3 protein [Jiangella muralis]|uniref:glycoside hydrolase family 3 protein n=1 Tax=Jiangella muralis TaxID=702383 RepID=UPI00069FD1D1